MYSYVLMMMLPICNLRQVDLRHLATPSSWATGDRKLNLFAGCRVLFREWLNIYLNIQVWEVLQRGDVVWIGCMTSLKREEMAKKFVTEHNVVELWWSRMRRNSQKTVQWRQQNHCKRFCVPEANIYLGTICFHTSSCSSNRKNGKISFTFCLFWHRRRFIFFLLRLCHGESMKPDVSFDLVHWNDEYNLLLSNYVRIKL